MANVRKRILELTPLPSASLDTTIVGVDNGTTYRIELDVLADAVTSRVNILDRDRLASLESVTSSFESKGRSVISSSTQITTLGFISTSVDLTSLNTFTQSIDGRVDSLENATSSYLTSLNGTISSSAQITSFGFISQSVDITSLNSFTSSQQTLNTAFTNGINARLQTSSFNDFSTSVDSRIIAATNEQSLTHLVTTSSFNEYTASISTASLVTSISNLNSATSSYLTSLSGAISSSSQLTSSFDERYTLSGSVQPLPDGLISGSSQLTSSYDTRYALSSSLSSISSSFNSRFNGLVTTGSNTFSGSQIFSGSMTVTSGQVIASTITNNSSSLFLQSGSNLYVQNNGIVEITGSLRVSGLTTFVAGGGDEGGEIQFGIPTTNTTLQNRVTVDIFQNKYRIFEGSNDAKGVYIDLSKAPVGNNGEITYKTSGIVNAGTFVTLDNIKATVTTSGQRGLSLATVSGTFACNIGGNYAGSGVGSGGTSGTTTITTSASTSIFGWGFTNQGDFANYIITDTTNSKAYRIIIQIGNGFNNNLVSIERLH
jgi:hypothetical protein